MAGHRAVLDRNGSGFRDFNQVLHRRGTESPGRLAFGFLDELAEETSCLSYGGLLAHAQEMARALQAKFRQGDRVVVLQTHGFPFIKSFFGCLYGGFVAVPLCPPPSTTPGSLDALRAIVRDTRARAVLVHPKWRARFRQVVENDPELSRLEWIEVGELDPQAAMPDADPSWSGDIADAFPAVLQYTSGSTSVPKGVAISHANFLHNSTQICRRFGHHPESSRGLIWLPAYHDMGLVGGILQPIFSGVATDLISPIAIIKRPYTWLKAISQRRATVSGGPSFAYRLAMEKVGEEQLAELDLGCWAVAFNGAEPVDLDLIERFSHRFAACGFRRSSWFVCYGLAESTLLVSGPQTARFPVAARSAGRTMSASDGDHVLDTRQQVVGCGTAIDGLEVVVTSLDGASRCEDGQIGEIWVRGPSVAGGYWSRAESRAIPFDGQLDDKGPFLRTGDLGFNEDHELFVCGRISTLLLIRGRNYQATDVERVAESASDALEPGACAALQVDGPDGEARLVLVHEVRRTALRTLDPGAVGDAITEKVASAFGVRVAQVVLTTPGAIPRTTSGKIRRAEARREYLDGTLESVESRRTRSAADGGSSASDRERVAP